MSDLLRILGIGLAIGCAAAAVVLICRRLRRPKSPSPERLSEVDPWEERAVAAEDRANRAEAALKAGLVPHIARFLRTRLFVGLMAERSQLISQHQEAADRLEDIEERLARVNAPVTTAPPPKAEPSASPQTQDSTPVSTADDHGQESCLPTVAAPTGPPEPSQSPSAPPLRPSPGQEQEGTPEKEGTPTKPRVAAPNAASSEQPVSHSEALPPEKARAAQGPSLPKTAPLPSTTPSEPPAESHRPSPFARPASRPKPDALQFSDILARKKSPIRQTGPHQDGPDLPEEGSGKK